MDNIKLIVRDILENETEARNDDDLLCALVDAKINKDILSVDYITVRKNRAKYGLPSTETITRVRRMLQKDYPELKGYDWVTRMRARREKMFRQYFREHK